MLHWDMQYLLASGSDERDRGLSGASFCRPVEGFAAAIGLTNHVLQAFIVEFRVRCIDGDNASGIYACSGTLVLRMRSVLAVPLKPQSHKNRFDLGGRQWRILSSTHIC